MKVALIGASGFVGMATLKELLQRGHHVTAIVRNIEKISEQKNLSIISADVFNEIELINALKGNDAVISAYNPGWANLEIYNEFIKGSNAIISAIKQAGIKRFIVVGGAGSLFIEPDKQLVDSEDFLPEIKQGALAARDFLNIIKEEKDLDWTYLSPAIEMHPGTSGIRKGAYRTGLENPVYDTNKRSIISVEDTAVAIVDELENPKHIKQRFTIAY